MRANENKHSHKNLFPLSGKRNFIEKEFLFLLKQNKKKGKKDKKSKKVQKGTGDLEGRNEGVRNRQVEARRNARENDRLNLWRGCALLFNVPLLYPKPSISLAPTSLSLSRYLIFSRTLSLFH